MGSRIQQLKVQALRKTEFVPRRKRSPPASAAATVTASWAYSACAQHLQRIHKLNLRLQIMAAAYRTARLASTGFSSILAESSCAWRAADRTASSFECSSTSFCPWWAARARRSSSTTLKVSLGWIPFCKTDSILRP